MAHCPSCHQDYDAPGEAAEAEAVEQISSDEVEIARIQAERDVTLARIQSKTEEHVAEVVVEADLAHAEGKAEGLETAIAPPVPEAEPEPVAVIVNENEEEPEPEMAPEPVHEHHESEESEALKSSGRRSFFY
jgi:hypothetical protein